jgi:ferredoxin
MVVVKAMYCPQNHPCPMVRTCPESAIHQEGYNAPTIDDSRCAECGLCTKSCRAFSEQT